MASKLKIRGILGASFIGALLCALLPSCRPPNGQITFNFYGQNLGNFDHLAFLVEPSNSAAGAVINPAIQVEFLTPNGTLDTLADGSVQLSIGYDAGPGSVLSGGPLSVNAAGGIAKFSGLNINVAGIGYTLAASSIGIPGTISFPFNISASPAFFATWMGGSNGVGQAGSYGAQGAGSTSNIPGARQSAVSFTDTAGNFWLFGGNGFDGAGVSGDLNDLWEFNPSSGDWTWVSGTQLANQAGTYGVLGTGSTSNLPGSRVASISWRDSSDNLWLFGGSGDDAFGAAGFLNDLWEFTPSTLKWTWIAGSNAGNQLGTWGTLGTGSTANIPSAREDSVSWIDSSGNFWLFGGYGYDSTGIMGLLNDLWEFTPSNLKWTWVGGSNLVSKPGIYGTQGTGSTTNIPGSRGYATSWTDTSGNFWLFGDDGDVSNSTGPLPWPMRTSAGFFVTGLWGNTRIQSFPLRLRWREMVTRAALICWPVMVRG